MPPDEPARARAQDPGATFRAGTWVGKPFQEIDTSGAFGQRITPRARAGSWGVPHRLDYAGRSGSDDTYEVHIGFFANREAAYFLFQKRSLEPGITINNVEARNLLFKVAFGGEWKEVAEGQAPRLEPPAKPPAHDFGGTFYEYTQAAAPGHRLFGYRLHNKKQLLVWPPSVLPNLGGTSGAPPAELERSLKFGLLEEPAVPAPEGADFAVDPFS